jgi:repressor LexA
MEPLTERQKAVLDFVVEYIRVHRFPPTVREIGRALGIRSTNGVSDHLKALERKGFLERRGMKSRALVPTEKALALREKAGEASVAPRSEEPVRRSQGTLLIPVLGKVAAGAPILAQESWETAIEMDRGLLGRNADAVNFALHVSGDSMIGDGIHDGDLVLVRQQPTARPGEIVVARIDDEATVKRFYPEGERIRLQPSNPRLSPIYVGPEDGRDVQILGVVVGLFRQYVRA